MNQLNKVVNKTNGKKTESLGILMILFQAFVMIKPDYFNPATEKVVTMVIGSGVIPTLLHRIYRNRKTIFNKLKSWKKEKDG